MIHCGLQIVDCGFPENGVRNLFCPFSALPGMTAGLPKTKALATHSASHAEKVPDPFSRE